MTIPNAGDFEVHPLGNDTAIICPECRDVMITQTFTLRDLINAASAHARTAHSVSVPA